LKTVKRLFASSGGICAFPGCTTNLVDPESKALLGEMCHISAASSGGPRFDPSLSEQEQSEETNLIILCPTHHSLIDQDSETYTSTKLKSIKAIHEANVAAILKTSTASSMQDFQATDLARQIDGESVDFAIVVALKKELDALLHHIPELKKVQLFPDDTRSYYKANLQNGQGGRYKIIVTLLPSMGNLNAAHATSDLINRWNPRYILVVGIAGGLNRQNQSFGDIIISESIVYYEPGKVRDNQLEVRNRQFLADRTLLDRINNLSDSTWRTRLPARPDGENPNSDIPRIHVGPIASGEKVVASAAEVERLLSTQHNLIGIEMESAGVASAAFSALKKIGFITIRSICDFADDKKSDNWQSYAAHAASAYLRTFIESGHIALSTGDWPRGSKEVASLHKESKIEKRKRLSSEFCTAMDMGEFKSFCFVLGVDIDELPGNRKSERVQELILLFERRNAIDSLEDAFTDFRSTEND
jgi:nucleoside phosphorylase